jgi:hypothetical protein
LNVGDTLHAISEALARTGVVQSERQVLEMAREHFGLDKPGGTL